MIDKNKLTEKELHELTPDELGTIEVDCSMDFHMLNELVRRAKLYESKADVVKELEYWQKRIRASEAQGFQGVQPITLGQLDEEIENRIQELKKEGIK